MKVGLSQGCTPVFPVIFVPAPEMVVPDVELITYAALPTPESVKPALIAIAFTVCVLLTVMGVE